MMRPLAHSAQNDSPAQTYQDHVENVWKRATRYAAQAEGFASDPSSQLQKLFPGQRNITILESWMRKIKKHFAEKIQR